MIRIIAPGKRTTASLESKFSDAFVPNWDAKPGPLQHTAQIIQRAAMGQKKTPIGRTRLKPQR